MNNEICWNCKNFDSFACVCHVHGIGKDAMDTCDKFRKAYIDISHTFKKEVKQK